MTDRARELLERLRAKSVIREGEPVTLALADGSVIHGSTGDVVQTRNPDGEEAAAFIEQQAATIKKVRAAARQGQAALNRMMDAWLDYHDAHSLTEPVTGRSGAAFEDALQARDAIEATLLALNQKDADHGK